jgi:hypothetical protein
LERKEQGLLQNQSDQWMESQSIFKVSSSSLLNLIGILRAPIFLLDLSIISTVIVESAGTELTVEILIVSSSVGVI